MMQFWTFSCSLIQPRKMDLFLRRKCNFRAFHVQSDKIQNLFKSGRCNFVPFLVYLLMQKTKKNWTILHVEGVILDLYMHSPMKKIVDLLQCGRCNFGVFHVEYNKIQKKMCLKVFTKNVILLF